MAKILCEDCRDFKYTYDPQISKVLYGHCRAIEYPFLLGIFKERGLEPGRLPRNANSSTKRKSRIRRPHTGGALAAPPIFSHPSNPMKDYWLTTGTSA